MKSPRHQRMIVIDITNAWDKRCGSCTRRLEVRAQAAAMGLPQEKFMFMDAFAKAVRKWA